MINSRPFETHAVAFAGLGTSGSPGVTTPYLQPSTVLWTAAGVAAVVLIHPRLTEIGEAIGYLGTADALWLAAAVLASCLSYIAAAGALTAATPIRLPFGRTIAVQVSGSFVNALLPGGLGAMGLNERYLERAGLRRSQAVAAVGLATLVAAVVHVMALVITAYWVGEKQLIHLPAASSGWLWGVGTAVVALVAGGVWYSVGNSRRITDALFDAGSTIKKVITVPRRAAILAATQLSVTTMYIGALVSCTYAFGGSPALELVAFVYLGGAAAGAASPTPSGTGVIEAVLVGGLVLAGVNAATAIAGVLAFRLVTYWIPALIGLFVFRRITRMHFV